MPRQHVRRSQVEVPNQKKKHNMNQCVTTAFHTHVFDVLSKRGDDRFVLSVAVTTASSLVAVATAILFYWWR